MAELLYYNISFRTHDHQVNLNYQFNINKKGWDTLKTWIINNIMITFLKFQLLWLHFLQKMFYVRLTWRYRFVYKYCSRQQSVVSSGFFSWHRDLLISANIVFEWGKNQEYIHGNLVYSKETMSFTYEYSTIHLVMMLVKDPPTPESTVELKSNGILLSDELEKEQRFLLFQIPNRTECTDHVSKTVLLYRKYNEKIFCNSYWSWVIHLYTRIQIFTE